MPVITRVAPYRKFDKQPVHELAKWAETSTWGGSMFLFPDAGRELYPGAFRGESRRALWVDWKSGRLVTDSGSFAVEWWRRWQQTMQGDFSPKRMENLLSLPIDYYVLKRRNQLADLKPVFISNEFVVYDARDLRNATLPLRIAAMPWAELAEARSHYRSHERSDWSFGLITH
jgi:hypothetical protein